jgi:DNA/RNA-binding domain of Phe-tRNA-synthetase-like protein
MRDSGPGVEVRVEVPGVAIGWVVASDCRVTLSPPDLAEEIRAEVARAREASESAQTMARRAAVRDLLRFGRYKPTGRAKPASEYLLHVAVSGELPAINTLVDINNLVSLASVLPISVFDLEKAWAEAFLVRRGRPGESYIFNASGQVIDLEDLLLTARLPADSPCASPVKDAQATKTSLETTEALALVYAPASLARAAEDAARRMATLIARHCGARTSHGTILGPPA